MDFQSFYLQLDKLIQALEQLLFIVRIMQRNSFELGDQVVTITMR